MEDTELDVRASKIKMALMLLNQQKRNTTDLIMKLADKLDLHPCDIDIIYHSDCLEEAIAVAQKMGVEVDLDSFFEAMRESIKQKAEIQRE